MRLSDQDKVNDIVRIPQETTENISEALDQNIGPLRSQMINHNLMMRKELETLQEHLSKANEN